MNKEVIMQQFRKWQEGLGRISDIPVSARDFDSWIAGYVSGWSLGKETNLEETQNLIRQIAASGDLEDIGVTGTAKDGIEGVVLHITE